MIPIPLNTLGVIQNNDSDVFTIKFQQVKQIKIRFDCGGRQHTDVYVVLGDGNTWQTHMSDSPGGVWDILNHEYAEVGNYELKIKSQYLGAIYCNEYGASANIVASNFNFSALNMKYGALTGLFYNSKLSVSLQQIAAHAPQGGWQGIRIIDKMFYGCAGVTGSQSVFLAKFPDLTSHTDAFTGTSTTT